MNTDTERMNLEQITLYYRLNDSEEYQEEVFTGRLDGYAVYVTAKDLYVWFMEDKFLYLLYKEGQMTFDAMVVVKEHWVEVPT